MFLNNYNSSTIEVIPSPDPSPSPNENSNDNDNSSAEQSFMIDGTLSTVENSPLPSPSPISEISFNTMYSERSIMTTPLNEYTVTEGLLFVLVVIVCFVSVISIFKKG